MSRLSPITPKQQAVLDFVRTYVEKNGQPPLQREIERDFGLRPMGVHKHLVALHLKGAIFLHGWPRGITVLENGRKQPLDMNPAI